MGRGYPATAAEQRNEQLGRGGRAVPPDEIVRPGVGRLGERHVVAGDERDVAEPAGAVRA